MDPDPTGGSECEAPSTCTRGNPMWLPGTSVYCPAPNSPLKNRGPALTPVDVYGNLRNLTSSSVGACEYKPIQLNLGDFIR